MTSLRSQAWLPSVSTSAPAANSACPMSGVRPKPWLAFSALTTARSTREPGAQPRQGRDHRLAAGAADDVAEKQDAQRRSASADDHAAFGRDRVEPHIMRAGRHRVHLLRGIGAADRGPPGSAARVRS